MYVCLSLCLCLYIYVYMYVYVYIYTHTHTHTIIDLCYKTHYIRKSEWNLLLKELQEECFNRPEKHE